MKNLLKATVKAAVLAFLLCLPLGANAFTKQEIIENHKFCASFLKLSKQAQEALAKTRGITPKMLPKYVAACRAGEKMGVEREWELEQIYQREHSRSSRHSSSGSSNSSSADSGTCYGWSNCNGSSTGRTNWGASGCGGSSMSFMPDHGASCVNL